MLAVRRDQITGYRLVRFLPHNVASGLHTCEMHLAALWLVCRAEEVPYIGLSGKKKKVLTKRK
jgi:hypothetical protein